MQLGKILRENRKELGWTQGVAAREIGIQQSYLSKLENDQFIPSQDVLLRLKDVYQLSEQQLPDFASSTQTHSSRKHNLLAIVVFCFALLFIFLGQTGVFYSQTFYTYQAIPTGTIDKQQVMLNYELTDEYRGEVYQAKFAGQTYTYQLLGSRKISRKENTWLTLFGVLLIMVSAVLAYLRRIQKVGAE